VEEINLFTDGSVHPQSGVGYGAYLIVIVIVIESELPLNVLRNQVRVKRFEDTSSTKLELQVLLHALNEIKELSHKINIYTDSQNIIRLPLRQEYLEYNQYRSRKNELINNHLLYKEFYKITNSLSCEFIKVKGHKISKDKDRIDRIFNLVDKASRSALRTELPKRAG
jgi:ribonuclease HI